MSKLLSSLKEEEEINRICREHSLNMALLKNLFLLSAKGYNNTILANKLGIHRVTVQRYAESLKRMKQSDYLKLFTFVVREEDVKDGR
ncbi:MAG: hypothetical protein HY516_02210 [Candidatus Aenigmarchaeota archaeon]|nr:hypothetical protein [Candidatus Aenigmarchaeota archaeon]